MTERLPADEAGLARAAQILAGGGLVAFPTDTVHGVACRPGDPDALGRLFELKGRPPEQRVAWLVADLEQGRSLGLEIDDRAERLAERFWPGGLTLVLAAGPSAPDDAQPTLGIRSPAHETTRALLRLTGPLPTSSANLHGYPDSYGTDDVLVALAGSDLLDAVVEGVSPRGVASTVVDLSVTPARLLREGALPSEALAEVVELAGR